VTDGIDLQPGEVYRFDFPEDTPPTYVRRLEDGSFRAVQDLRGGDYGSVKEMSKKRVQSMLDAGEVSCEAIDLEESPFNHCE